ncbi:MAG: DUF4419 domain-containing protein, partial [Myxococcota bacterium]
KEMGELELSRQTYEEMFGPLPSWNASDTIFINRALEHKDIPGGLHRIPFRCTVLGEQFDMAWAGGFVGCSQHPETGMLRPELGWAVLG